MQKDLQVTVIKGLEAKTRTDLQSDKLIFAEEDL